jgi:hypothetical protein
MKYKKLITLTIIFSKNKTVLTFNSVNLLINICVKIDLNNNDLVFLTDILEDEHD